MKNRFLSFLFILPFLASAQTHLDGDVFEIQCDSAVIARQKLQSMILVREFVSEPEYSPIIKLIDCEFNAYGLVTYVEKSVNFRVDHSFFDVNTKTQQRFQYDQKHRLSGVCRNERDYSICEEMEYDDAGNPVRLASYGSSADTTEIRMQWKAGKMVNATYKDPMAASDGTQRKMNEAGKIADYRSDNYHITYNYSKTGDEETTIIHTYVKDTLLSITTLKSKSDKKLPTYLLHLNHKLDTLRVMMAAYDMQGNVTSFESRDYSNVYLAEEMEYPKYEYEPESSETPFKQTPRENQIRPKPEPFTEKLELVNVYNDQNLLVKRSVYRVSKKGERTLMAIDRVIYEKEPLINKPWPEEKEEVEYWDEK